VEHRPHPDLPMRQWSYEAMVRTVERRSPSRGTSNQYIFWRSAMVELTVNGVVRAKPPGVE
jgi:hypothetical protein